MYFWTISTARFLIVTFNVSLQKICFRGAPGNGVFKTSALRSGWLKSKVGLVSKAFSQHSCHLKKMFYSNFGAETATNSYAGVASEKKKKSVDGPKVQKLPESALHSFAKFELCYFLLSIPGSKICKLYFYYFSFIIYYYYSFFVLQLFAAETKVFNLQHSVSQGAKLKSLGNQ